MEKEKRTRGITDVLLILVITILAGTVLILACGASPMEAYGLFFRGIFGTPAGFAEIFVKACPLILTGLGCAVAYRTGFFNIGAEGQFYVGAMATTMVALNWTAVPGIPRIILSLVIGFLAGGVWALIAAVCKAKFNISEIIVTIMLNYIAINFLGYAVRSFLMDPEGNVPQSAKIDKAVQLGNPDSCNPFSCRYSDRNHLCTCSMVFPGKNNYGIRIEGSWTEQTWKHLQRYFCYEKYCAFRLFKRRTFCSGRWNRGPCHSEKASGGNLLKLWLYGCFDRTCGI